MNKIVVMRPVIDIHAFENLIAQKLGYEDKDAFHKSLRSEGYGRHSALEKVRDHIGWSIVDVYGNNTFEKMYVSENFTADWASGDDGYGYGLTEKEAELFNKIDRIVLKLVEDGEIPDEFVLHVWW